MKLCKDCKHALLPHPLAQLGYYPPIYVPMCGHPDAERSIVDGSLRVTCEEARGVASGGRISRAICLADAKLFEPLPPKAEPELKPYSIVPMETERDRSFWEKAKHWFM